MNRNKKGYEVLKKYYLNDNTYVLRFTRNNLQFIAGQSLSVGSVSSINSREYSIFSGEKDDYLEILVKKVEDGKVSRELDALKIGARLKVEGPGGGFTLSAAEQKEKDYLWIASGTGISPYRSMLRSHGSLKYRVIHGIQTLEDAYGMDFIAPANYITCTSREASGVYAGRVTAYLNTLELSKDTKCYICGNSNMIFDVYDILKNKNITSENIVTEVYF